LTVSVSPGFAAGPLPLTMSCFSSRRGGEPLVFVVDLLAVE